MSTGKMATSASSVVTLGEGTPPIGSCATSITQYSEKAVSLLYKANDHQTY